MTDAPGGAQTVLVTGATGALGPRVVAAFKAHGYRVRALALTGNGPRQLPEDVELLTGNITDRAAVACAMDGVSKVIHLAALLHIVNPTPDLEEAYREINVHGTQVVVEAAMRAGVERVVMSSTIAVYGPSQGEILSEASTPHPDSIYAITKLAAEQIVLAARTQDHLPMGVVLRLGAVYGSRVKGNYRQLLKALRRGVFVPVGPGVNRRTLLYDRDAARALHIAAEEFRCAGRVFNVSDGCYHTLQDILGAMCAALDRTAPKLAIPLPVAQHTSAALDTLMGVVRPRSRRFVAALNKYTEDIAVDASRFVQETGFQPRYSLAAGWRETVADMRAAGEL